jgi:hypothetical protein
MKTIAPLWQALYNEESIQYLFWESILDSQVNEVILFVGVSCSLFSLPFHQAQGYKSSKDLRHHSAYKKFPKILDCFWVRKASPSMPLSTYGSDFQIELRGDTQGDLLPRTLYKDIIHL